HVGRAERQRRAGGAGDPRFNQLRGGRARRPALRSARVGARLGEWAPRWRARRWWRWAGWGSLRIGQPGDGDGSGRRRAGPRLGDRPGERLGQWLGYGQRQRHLRATAHRDEGNGVRTRALTGRDPAGGELTLWRLPRLLRLGGRDSAHPRGDRQRLLSDRAGGQRAVGEHQRLVPGQRTRRGVRAPPDQATALPGRRQGVERHLPLRLQTEQALTLARAWHSESPMRSPQLESRASFDGADPASPRGVGAATRGPRPRCALAAAFTALVISSLGCSDVEETRTLAPRQVAISRTDAPIYDDGELTIFESKIGIEFPLLAPTREQRRALNRLETPAPYPSHPWIENDDLEVQV